MTVRTLVVERKHVLHGRVDSFGAPKLSVSGPLARTAADATLIFDAMAQGAAHTHAPGEPGAGGESGMPGIALDAVPITNLLLTETSVTTPRVTDACHRPVSCHELPAFPRCVRHTV